MTFLPIVTRELRVAARRWSTYWTRSAAGLLVMAVGTVLYIMVENEPPKDVATYLFVTLTGTAALYALLSGIRNTADCISQEKREGTLGLLFLTDLKGYDVVLGKLVANSVNAFYAVLAVLPMLAVPLLMGGLTPGEFGRMAVVVLNALFFSLAVGMCVSALSRSAQRAAWLTAAVIGAVTLLLPLCGFLIAVARNLRTIEPWFLLPSTAFAYGRALEGSYRAGPVQFWQSVFLIHGLGWIALALASRIVPHVWQDRPAGVTRLKWRERIRLWSYGGTVERRQFRQRLLGQNAFFWLSARARTKPTAVWVFLMLLASGWAWGLAKYRREWLTEGMYLGTALVLNFVLRCWFASEAARQLAEDRRAGALELLLCTPLSVRDILCGQRLALARQFLAPTVVVIGIEALFMKVSVSDNLGSPPGFWYSLYFGLMLMLVADLVALYWVGMWQGLTARNHGLAFNATIGRIMVWPWAMTLGFLAVTVLLVGNQNLPEPGWAFLLALWFLTGICADVVFGSAARTKLMTEFRLAAQLTHGRRIPWWRRFGVHSSPQGLPTRASAAKPGERHA